MIIGGYALSSSGLALVNKLSLVGFDYPNTLLQLQFASAASVSWLLGRLGLARVDGLDARRARDFLPAVVLFYASCFANVQLLRHVNVDTFVVVRSCTPLAVLAVELARAHVPRSMAAAELGALALMGVSAALYAGASSAELTRAGVCWALVYLGTMCANGVLVKGVVTRARLSPWGLVLYNNALAVALAPVASLASVDGTAPDLGLRETLGGALVSLRGSSGPALASCVGGLAISFFGLQARQLLSPTSFAVVGVANKAITVAANAAMWDRHASAVGTCWLAVCIGSAFAHQQLEQRRARIEQASSKPSLSAAGPDASASLARPAAAGTGRRMAATVAARSRANATTTASAAAGTQ